MTHAKRTRLMDRFGFGPVVVALGMTVMCGGLTVSAQETLRQKTLVANVVVQDEPMRLPKDNTVAFTSRAPRIQLDVQYLADIGSPSETQLTVVTPNGSTQELTPDGNGNFVLSNPVSGLYAVVAKTATAIASIPFYAKQVGNLDGISNADNTVTVPVIPDGRAVNDRLVEQYVSYTEPKSVDPIRYDYDESDDHGYQVRLSENGRLPGQIIIPSDRPNTRGLLAENNVFLIRNGVRLQSVVSDARGQFALAGLSPGVYGIVAAGPAGYTSFSFEALPTDSFASDNTVDSMQDAGFVAANAAAEPASVLPVVMVPPELVPSVVEAQRRDDLLGADGVFPAEGVGTPVAGSGAAPAGGGFGPGGSYGGGYGGGGGGGFGDLSGLLGLAGLAILADSNIFDSNDNDFNQGQPIQPVPPPISPAVPFTIQSAF
ncbi:hypothetical protein Mal65_08510 [Crateriforma conspicua]|nr:hypothetical protein Mal65_08510 [Crateriforma conspicua]